LINLYPDEFLDFSEEIVLSNSASVTGIITIFGKHWVKSSLGMTKLN